MAILEDFLVSSLCIRRIFVSPGWWVKWNSLQCNIVMVLLRVKIPELIWGWWKAEILFLLTFRQRKHCFVVFFFFPTIRQRKQNIWRWHFSCYSATETSPLLSSEWRVFSETSYKLVVGHGGDIDRERCTVIGPEITVTRCSKGLSIHMWGKWENRSLNEWVTSWKQGRGCRLYSPKYLLHFTRQCPRQPWDPYITLKLTLVWIANWIAWHPQ